MRKIWERLMSAEGKRWLRRASYLLIGVGVLLLVIAGVNIGYRQWERRRLEARLTRTAPTATAVPELTAVPTTAEPQEPTDTPEPPTATKGPSATPTVVRPTEASPTMVPTATPTLAPTPTTPPVAELPVQLSIPDLGIDAPVVEMGWTVDEVGGVRTSVWDLDAIEGGVVGHLTNSALPGQTGNVVMAGHHNIEGEVFKNLSLVWDDEDAEQQEDGVTWRSDKLDGRAITLGDAAGQSFTYVVEGMYKLPDKDVSQAQREDNGRFMDPTDEPTLTLVTCWPFSSNTHRIVVVARLAGTES
jgi:sortase A